MPTATICAESGCTRLIAVGTGSRCTEHATMRARADNARRNALPRRRVYATATWRKLRHLVLVRDGFACTECGYMPDDGRSNLVVDHIGGIDYDDPYDIDRLRVLCRTCSGRIDGARGTYG